MGAGPSPYRPLPLLLRLVLPLFFAWADPGLAQNPATGDSRQPSLSSNEPIEYDREEGVMRARGEAEFIDGPLLIQAQEIRYFPEERRAEAVGNVRITRGELRMVARRITFLRDGRRFSGEDFRVGQPPFVATGRRFHGNLDEVILENVTVYQGRPGRWSPQARAERAIFDSGKRVSLTNPRVGIDALPMTPLPDFSRSLEGLTLFDIRVGGGYSDNLGAHLETSAILPVGRNLSPGFVLNGYTERGIMVGPAFRARIQDQGHFLDSRFESGFLDDQGGREALGQDILGEAIGSGRHYAEWRHRQRIGEKLAINAQIRSWSDSEITRDFAGDFFERLFEPDNFAEVTWTESNFHLSLFSRFAPNDFHRVQERLPELRFDFFTTPLPRIGPVQAYHNGSASFARLREDPLPTEPNRESLESDRGDLWYQILIPWQPLKGVHLTARGGGRATHYTDTLADDGEDFTRVLGMIGFDASADFFGTWERNDPIWQINGLRHRARPLIQYRYIPSSDIGDQRIPPIDDEPFFTSMEPIDFHTTRNIDRLGELHVIRFGFENSLETRHEKHGTRELLRLNFYNDYRLSHGDEEDAWGDLYTHLELSPAYWLDLDLWLRHDLDELGLQEVRMLMGLVDRDRWRLNLGTVFLQDRLEQYLIEGSWNFTTRFGLFSHARYDARVSEWTEFGLGIRRWIADTWDVTAELTLFNGDEREGSFDLRFGLSLLSF